MEITDEQLIEEIAQDSEQAYKTLFMRYFARLCAFVSNFLYDDEQVRDVVQKVFVRIWEIRKSLMITRTVSGYLFTASRHEAYNYIKMAKTRQQYEAAYADDQARIASYEMEEDPDNRLQQLVADAIDLLPDKCRRVYRLSREEGLTYEEIANHLQVSVKTVENQVGNALKKIREHIKPKLAERYG